MAQPTMQDVAAEAGVSRALVSLVMRDSPKVSDARRAAVHKAADKLGYRPNVLARNLAARRTETIGVMINDLHNPFFAEAVDGVLEAADEADHQVLLATGTSTRSGEAGAIETFLRFRVDGVVLAGPRLAAAKIAETAKVTPTVLLGRTTRSGAVDTVNNDELVGAALAVQHLVELGHTRIAHIDGGRGAGAAARRKGYERAMQRAGLEDHIMVANGDFTEISGARGADALLTLEARPSAIFAANDLSAIGAINRAGDLGLSAPDDVSIVGYDNSSLAAMQHFSLTTINQPREEMGRAAVDLLMERINERRQTAIRHVVTPTLVQRSSTAPPPPQD